MSEQDNNVSYSFSYGNDPLRQSEAETDAESDAGEAAGAGDEQIPTAVQADGSVDNDTPETGAAGSGGQYAPQGVAGGYIGYITANEEIASAAADPDPAAEAQPQADPYADFAPEEGSKEGPAAVYTRPEEKKRGRGRKLALGVGALLLMFLVGYAGGRLAMRDAVNEIEASIKDNFSTYLEEAGGAVLYRDVQTDYTTTGEANEMSVADVTELAADSVVEILTETQVTTTNPFSWFFGGNGESQSIVPGAGSGVVLSENGYILTSYHVIADAQTITVGLRSGYSFDASVVGVDEEKDVAVIKIDPVLQDDQTNGEQKTIELSPAVLGDSGQLAVGSPVVAIGNPLGQLGGTVTAGYISALDRSLQVDGKTYNLLQTDAAINGGNSGGGLFNAQGELIGLVMAKSSGISANGMVVEGLGFAIPINDIKDIIEDLINYGKVNRVTLGIRMVDIMDNRTAASYYVDELGVYILTVEANSNASYAGLQAGDRIVSVDGVQIENGNQVVDIISSKQFNDTMEMVVAREGEEITLTITLYATIPDEGAVIPTSL